MEQRPFWGYFVYDLRRWWPLFAWWMLRVWAGHLSVTVVIGGSVAGVAVVAYSVAKWRRCRYRFGRSVKGFHSIGVRQGLLCRRALHIDAENAASVEIERSPLLFVLGGCRVRVNTAGLRRRADAVLYLSAAQTRKLFSLRDRGQKRFRARAWPVLLMSLSGSNAAVGLLTAAPALRYVGRLLGERLGTMTGVFPQLFTAELPAVFRILANALMIGWGIAALRNFLRYVGFYAVVQDTQLHLVSGLFTRRDVLIDKERVTALELRQTLLMRGLGLFTAVISVAGYGRELGARPVLIPAAEPRTLCDGLERLLGGYPVKVGRVKVARSAYGRYVAFPLLVTLCGMPFWLIGGFWRVAALVCAVFGTWWLLVRWLGFRSAGFGMDSRAVTLWYPRGLALYRVYLPREVVDHITVTQSWWQRRRGTCTASVRCFGDKKRRHRVWGLPYDAVRYEIQQR